MPDYRSVVASQTENIRVPSMMLRHVQFLVDEPSSFEEHEEQNGMISSKDMAMIVESRNKDNPRHNKGQDAARRESSNENCCQNGWTKRLKYSKEMLSCATNIQALTGLKENDFLRVDPSYQHSLAQRQNRSLRTLWIINEVMSILHEEEEAMS